MKTMFKQLSKVAMLLAITTLVLTSCKKDEEVTPGPELTGKSESYTLYEAGNSGISGTIKFEERTDNSTVITMSLTGATGEHPAHIHANTAAEGGGIMIDLAAVDALGASITEVAALNDGTAVTYDELIVFDGYVNVHKSATELGVLVAQGDIGQNALTENSENYELFEVKAGVSGTVTFKERNNGETLVIVELTGTTAGAEHASHIHANTFSEGGGIMVTLTSVNGDSGISQTNVSALDDGTAITYSELLDFNGYVQSHDVGGTPIARGDIGQNALTGTEMVYALNELNTQGVSGTITFSERKNGFTLVSISISGAGVVGDQAAHIHDNNVSMGGGVTISLSKVNADGVSLTSVTALNDGTEMKYTNMIGFNGYAQVHNPDLSALTNGNIGSN